jgi:hypothetical protein
MARKTKEQEVSMWQRRIQISDAWVEEKSERWEKRVGNLRGKYWEPQRTPDGDLVTVNMIAALDSLFIPAIYFRDPRIIVSARRPQDTLRAEFTEEVLNYYIDELELKSQVTPCIRDAFLFGIAYMKLGWEAELDTNLEFVRQETEDGALGEVMTNDAGEPFMSDPAGNIFLDRPTGIAQVMDKKGNPVSEVDNPTLNEWVRREQPHAVRWHPKDVLRDPEGRNADLSDSRWIAFRAVLPLEEVKGNPLYKNTTDLQATRKLSHDLLDMTEKRTDDETAPEEERRVEIYEIWAKEYNKARKRYDMKRKVIAKDHDKFLLDEDSPFLAEGFPCAVLTFTGDPDDPYPTSMADFVEDQIQSMNVSRTMLATHRNRFFRRYIANEAVVSREDAEQVANASDGQVVMVNVSEDVDLRRAFVPIEDAQLQPEVYNDYNLARDEIQIITGVSDYQFGGQGVSRLATEANFIQGGFAVRLNHKQDMVGDFVIHICKYWKQLLQQFGSFEVFAEVTGEQAEPVWQSFAVAENIPDDVAFSADMFPSTFQAREVLQKAAQDRLNLLAPFIQMGLVDPLPLIEDIFKSHGIEDGQRYLTPQAQQLFEQMKQNLMAVAAQGGLTTQNVDLNSIMQSGAAADTNQLREPAATDVGATGRAASGSPGSTAQ